MKLSRQPSHPARQQPRVTFIAILISIVINIWSNFFPLNGVSVATLSNTQFAPVEIIPANYAFAIWGLVYLSLIAFGFHQFKPSQRYNSRLQKSRYLLVIACIAQCAWIYLFLARLFPLSVVAMLGILLPLIGMYKVLNIGQQAGSFEERWFIHIPISIYLAWISVATIVNIAIMLYSSNWNGWGISPAGWTFILMLIAAGIAALITIKHRDTAYPLVTIWALVAIAIRQISIPLVAVTALGLAIALTLLTFRRQFMVWLKSFL